MLEIYSGSPIVVTLIAGLFGLLVGSFLNVVSYRLPIIMQLRWHNEASEIQATPKPNVEQPFNLSVPRSACPNCGHKITAIENIPVLSYLVLRGKCRGCRAPISLQYPFVELLTGVLSMVVAWKFGFSWQTLAALGLLWSLVALADIDRMTQLLPDDITLPLLWLGILCNIPEHGLFTDLKSSVIGAIGGYMILWFIFQVFKLITGKEGMGYGDFKLLAALGAWLGWQYLPTIILLSSFFGALVGITLKIRNKSSGDAPIPFGPFLAAAGFAALIWGEQLNAMYLSTTGLQ